MKPIKQIIAMYPSQNKCAAELGIHPSQLTRWVKAGAQVDADGYIWVKTKRAVRIWPDSSERVDIVGQNGSTGYHYQKSEYLK